jgi:sugar phosphate isomerase/epimerase
MTTKIGIDKGNGKGPVIMGVTLQNMKLSYPVSVPDHNVQVSAFTGDLEENFRAISELGYTGIELLVREPKKVSTKVVSSLLDKYNLEISAIGTSPMQIQDKLFLLHEDSENREEALKRCKDLIGLAAYFQVPALVGKYRGNISENIHCTKDALNRIFYKICEYAAKFNINILMEPQNMNNINNLNTVSESLEWIDELKLQNLGLLLDTYHMGYTEDSIIDSIIRAKDKIGFIHMSDTDRMVPGFGTLPIRDILCTLEAIKYKGYISMEIKQIPDSLTVAKLSYEALQYITHI